ncbi:hypothetical protein, partial [Streptomyces scabiei]|uniref:hypothetical protein n=1 Tax=Streptomyces scabiei TaxID=1930 RepID=UPI0029AB018D
MVVISPVMVCRIGVNGSAGASGKADLLSVAGWQVIGHYAHECEAGKALPAPVPPGVLRADVS